MPVRAKPAANIMKRPGARVKKETDAEEADEQAAAEVEGVKEELVAVADGEDKEEGADDEAAEHEEGEEESELPELSDEEEEEELAAPLVMARPAAAPAVLARPAAAAMRQVHYKIAPGHADASTLIMHTTYKDILYFL